MPSRRPFARTSHRSSVIDILDRILDKGIVIDAWARVSIGGIDLLTMEARVVVMAIETHLQHAAAGAEPVSTPRAGIDSVRRSRRLAATLLNASRAPLPIVPMRRPAIKPPVVRR